MSTTRLTVALLLTAAFSTFLVPRSAGSTRSFWGSFTSLQPGSQLLQIWANRAELNASSLHADFRVKGRSLPCLCSCN